MTQEEFEEFADLVVEVERSPAWSTFLGMDPAELLREIQKGRVDLETPLGWAVEQRLWRAGIDPRQPAVDEKELDKCPF